MRCVRHSLRLACVIIGAALAGCAGDSGADATAGEATRDPAELEVRNAAARGLPTRLAPADIDSPDYEPPRMRCAPALRDTDTGTELQLVRHHMRYDSWMQGDTAVTLSYAEGVYSVAGPPRYGLQAGQLLRVNCARQAATAVLGSDTPAARTP